MPEIKVILDFTPMGSPKPDGGGQSVWSFIWDVLKGVFGAIAGSLTTALTSAAKELSSMLTLNNLVGLGVNYIKEQASTWLTKAVTDLGHQEWLADFLHAAGLDFSDLLQAGKNALDAGFNVLTTDLTSALREAKLLDKGALDLVGMLLSDHKDAVTTAITASAGGTQVSLNSHASALAKAMADWSMFTSQSRTADEAKLQATLQAIFSDTPEKISETAKIQSGSQFSSLSDTGFAEIEERLPETSSLAYRILRPLQDKLNEVVLQARDIIFTILVPQLPVSYERVGASAASALGSAIGLGFAAHGLAVAADLIHPLKATGIPQISAFLADMAGFAAIARATWYEDIRNFLAIPYQHYSLKYFRPTMPRDSEVCRLFAEGCITEDDFRRAMEYWGYRESWINAYLRDVYKDPTARDVSLMLEDPTLQGSEIYLILRDGAYSPKSSEIFTKALKKKSLAPYMAAYRQALTDLYAEGYISDSQLYDQLDPLELSSEAYFLITKTASFKYVKNYLDAQIKLFSDQCEKGLISESELETALTALGLPPDKRTLISKSIKVKKQAKIVSDEKKEVEQQIRKAQQLVIESYILAYRAGSLDEGGLRSALMFAGLSEDMATITAEVERQKKAVTRAKKTETTIQRQINETLRNLEEAYVTLYRNGVIDLETLASYLSTLDLPDDYIQSVLMLEKYKKEKPPAVGIN
jgi:hypothetical protein